MDLTNRNDPLLNGAIAGFCAVVALIATLREEEEGQGQRRPRMPAQVAQQRDDLRRAHLPARKLSGAGWDNTQKIITLDNTTYIDPASSNPYINKPIRNYDKLNEIMGDDFARGESVTDSVGSNHFSSPNENPIDLDAQSPTPYPRTGHSKGSSSSGKKRNREQSEEISRLDSHVKMMAVAMSTGFQNIIIEKLGPVVYQYVGPYEFDLVDGAYRYLQTRISEAQHFIALPDPFRRSWLEEFGRNFFVPPPPPPDQ